MSDFKADLFVRGFGICRGTIFAGDILGSTHHFAFSDHQVRVCLPSVEFEPGSCRPSAKSAHVARFRSGRTDDPTPERSFYELEYVTVEVDFKEPVHIPSALLDNEAVQKSPELAAQAPHLNILAAQYDTVLASVWHQWMRVARWATNQYSIGLPDWATNQSAHLQMPRVHEKLSGYGVWASTTVIQVGRSASINAKTWEHIGGVLTRQLSPPIWIEYLAEARYRIANQDFPGCVLSSVIACETLARAAYMHFIGNPANTAAADRTAAQKIIGRWKDLTGEKADQKVHGIFKIRNELVHSGRNDYIDSQIAEDTLRTAQIFVESGDEWWFAKKGLSNPRITKLE